MKLVLDWKSSTNPCAVVRNLYNDDPLQPDEYMPIGQFTSPDKFVKEIIPGVSIPGVWVAQAIDWIIQLLRKRYGLASVVKLTHPCLLVDEFHAVTKALSNLPAQRSEFEKQALFYRLYFERKNLKHILVNDGYNIDSMKRSLNFGAYLISMIGGDNNLAVAFYRHASIAVYFDPNKGQYSGVYDGNRAATFPKVIGIKLKQEYPIASSRYFLYKVWHPRYPA